MNKAIEYLFLILITIVPLTFTASTSELFELPKIFLVYGLTILIFFFWSAKSIHAGKLIFRRTILDIPLVLFLLSLSLSTLTSIDIHTSIWGYYSRFNGGLLPTSTYAFLYWSYVSNMTSESTIRLIRFLLASALIVSLYAIAEHFGHSYSCVVLQGRFDTSCWAPKVQERVFATLGQPNWLAAWLVAILPLSWSFPPIPNFPYFHKFHNRFKLLFPLALSSLIFTAFIFTKSRSGLLGLGTTFAIFWFLAFLPYLPKFPRLPKKLVLLLVILITSHLSLITIFGSPWSSPLKTVLANFNSRGMNSATNSPTLPAPIGTESGDIRKIVWKGAIDIWKHYPILGSGPETFAYTYYNFRPSEHNLTSEWDLLYNKAHNEYLNYLANTGIVGLVSYFLLFGTFIVFCIGTYCRTSRLQSARELKWTRSDYATTSIAILAGYISLLVTNFFGFSVVTTSLLFFLFPAFAISLTSHNFPTPPTSFTKKSLLLKIPLITLTFLISLILLSKTYGLFHADQLYTKAKSYNKQDNPRQAAKVLQKALVLNHWEPKYYDELGDSASQIAVKLAEDNQPDNAKEFANLSKELSDQALRISPRNVSFWSARAIYFKRLAAVDPHYLDLAIQALEKTVFLAPTDATFRLNLAVLYNYSGDLDRAIKTLEETLRLKPDYNQARDDLDKLYIEKGESSQELKSQKNSPQSRPDPFQGNTPATFRISKPATTKIKRAATLPYTRE